MLEMTVNNLEEQEFFLSHLKPHMRVLEWGSGDSTLAIAKRVKQLVSIEHHHEWYDKMRKQIPKNVELLFCPPDNENYEGDGTYDDFRTYVDVAHFNFRQFDVIFIDGRARVACASFCHELGDANTLVFIHDYNHPDPKWRRDEYYAAEKYLERIEGVFTMWKFKIKS
jgi:protein-L-isoaspartate O-methyltransferase